MGSILVPGMKSEMLCYKPFVDGDAPSDACTGASISRFNMSSLAFYCTLGVFFNIKWNFSFNEKKFLNILAQRIIPSKIRTYKI